MSKHLKRLAVPRTWRIPRKGFTWAVKPRPGPHGKDESVPLLILVRDYLRLCDTGREAQRIIGSRHLHVDGKGVTDTKRAVGLMDVVSVPKLDKHYRVLLDTSGRLALVDIPKAKAEWKLCRIESKSTVSGGRFQIALHDGRSLQMKENKYAPGDVLKMRVPEQKVVEHFAFAEGALAYVTGGSHVGQLANVLKEEITHDPRANLVHLKGQDEFITVKPYVFIVGVSQAEIALPEASIA